MSSAFPKIEHAEPPAIVVMGVTGSGKTLVGRKLARALDGRFIEGDRFHPAENIERMRSGFPLDDAHRTVWLDAVGTRMRKEHETGRAVVAACSALKLAYRDRLRTFVPELSFLFLDIDRETAERRVAARRNHFMPASLVASQFETLERPDLSEGVLRIDATESFARVVESAVAYFGFEASAR